MKKILYIILLLPVLVFAQTGPKLVVDGGEALNSGNHLRGKEVVYDITFKNTGDADLKITGVQTTCGCSSALVSSDLIPPGGSGSVKFTFNGQGFGSVTKTLSIATNETESPNHIIQVTMNMVDPLTMNPQSIITEGKVGEELKQVSVITNGLDKDIDIIEVSSNSPVIKITSDKMHLHGGENASLDISIMIYEESAINAAILIKTTEGEFQIPVLVDVKSN
jgi:hypothetical protein